MKARKMLIISAIPIDVNFHLQKSLEILGNIQLTKSDPSGVESELAHAN